MTLQDHKINNLQQKQNAFNMKEKWFDDKGYALLQDGVLLQLNIDLQQQTREDFRFATNGQQLMKIDITPYHCIIVIGLVQWNIIWFATTKHLFSTKSHWFATTNKRGLQIVYKWTTVNENWYYILSFAIKKHWFAKKRYWFATTNKRGLLICYNIYYILSLHDCHWLATIKHYKQQDLIHNNKVSWICYKETLVWCNKILICYNKTLNLYKKDIEMLQQDFDLLQQDINLLHRVNWL